MRAPVKTGIKYQWQPLANQADTLTLSTALDTPQYVIEGQTLDLSEIATVSDPGFANAAFANAGTIYYSIDWGDNSELDSDKFAGAAAPGPTVGTIAGEHVFHHAGIFTVHVHSFDNNNAQADGTFQVCVSSTPTLTVNSTTTQQGDTTD